MTDLGPGDSAGLHLLHVSCRRPGMPAQRGRVPAVAPARLCCTPDDDSPWHTNSTAGLCCCSAATMSSGFTDLPGSALSSSTLAAGCQWHGI